MARHFAKKFCASSPKNFRPALQLVVLSVNEKEIFQISLPTAEKRIIRAMNLPPINNKEKRENIVYIYLHNNWEYQLQLIRRMPSTDDSRITPVTEIDACFFIFSKL